MLKLALAFILLEIASCVTVLPNSDLNAAIQAQPASTTFELQAGNYSTSAGAITLLAGDVLIGIPGQTFILKPVIGASNAIISGVTVRASSTCFSLSSANNFTLQRSEIGPCVGLAVSVSGGNDLRFFDNFLHAEYQPQPYSCCDGGDAMHFSGSSNVLVQGVFLVSVCLRVCACVCERCVHRQCSRVQ